MDNEQIDIRFKKSNREEWTPVRSRKDRNRIIKPIRRYWNGFDAYGELWFTEYNDGRIEREYNNRLLN